MSHSITTRQLNDSERHDLRRREPDSFLVGALGCSGGYFVAFLLVIALARIAESFGLRTWGAPAFFWILSLIPAAAGLRGQWMLDLDHGRADEQSLDPYDDSAPLRSSSFTVHRLPAGGNVLTVEAIGERLAPEGVLSVNAGLPSWMAPVRQN